MSTPALSPVVPPPSGRTTAAFRLLVISGAFPPVKAPESAHTLYLCQHLARRGLEVHLLTRRGSRTGGEEIPENLTVHPLMPDWRWRWLPKLARGVRAIAPDAVLLIYIDWIYGCQPMVTFSPTLLRRLLPPGVPFVTQFENESGLSGSAPPGPRARLARRLAARLTGGKSVDAVYGTLLRDSTEIIALSERHREAFERASPGVHTKTALIPAPPIMRICAADNGAARRRGRRKLEASDGERLLVYFGFVYPSKGLETLLRALALVPAGDDGPRLVVVGDSLDTAYLEGLRQLAREVGVSERVLWTGHCEPEAEEASLYLHAADVCVMPFDAGVRLNNSSFAVAATHGLPIITTFSEAEAPESVFVDGENVRLCPRQDPRALAGAIRELLSDAPARERLRAGALRLAAECFSWPRVVDATLKTLRRTNAASPGTDSSGTS